MAVWVHEIVVKVILNIEYSFGGGRSEKLISLRSWNMSKEPL